MTYNPADYQAVSNEAKGMKKEELEEYYTKDRDRRHSSCCGLIFGILILILFMGALIYFGTEIGKDSIKIDVSKNIESLTKDICPLIGGTYTSQKVFEEDRYDPTPNRIVCP